MSFLASSFPIKNTSFAGTAPWDGSSLKIEKTSKQPWDGSSLKIEKTSKRSFLPDFRGRQAAPGWRSFFVRKDKQAGRAAALGWRSFFVRKDKQAGSRHWMPAPFLSEKTSKHYSRTLVQASSNSDQEPWSKDKRGFVFSPWTTNDSTWEGEKR